MQQDKQTVSDFFNECTPHLQLRACVENISADLNNPQERDAFIGLLKRGKEIADLTHDEQASDNPAKMMKCQQGNLVSTLEEALQRLPPLTRSARSSDSPMQKKELLFQPCSSNQTTPCRSKPVQKAETVDSILFGEESFDKDNPHDVPVPAGLDRFKGLMFLNQWELL